MSPTWHSDTPPPAAREPGLAGWLRICLRGGAILVVLGLGVAIFALGRLGEASLAGGRRRATPWITVLVCRLVLRVLGLTWQVEGRPDPATRLVVANHVSWLDIFVLNAVRPVVFVAKAEVAGWTGIGLLARLTGTVFVAREARASAAQSAALRDRLTDGARLVLFPEGTSTDGLRVLRFRSTLFAAVEGTETRVQPVTLAYQGPAEADPRAYGWWGEMGLAPHLLAVLATAPQGAVRVVHHPALDAAGRARKALAAAAEAAVRSGLTVAETARITASLEGRGAGV